MKEPSVIFRTDASTALGSGHLMRCLTLSAALEKQGWHSHFAVNDEALSTVPSLAKTQPLVLGPTNATQPVADARSLQSGIPDGCDLLIVDHYGYDKIFESRCRGWAKRILVIDDLANRTHDCDVLIDQTAGRKNEEYADRVPAHCRLLMGATYALLRPEFSQARDQALHRRKSANSVETILVTMGGTDPLNATLKVLQGITASGTKAKIDVLMGNGSPHQKMVRSFALKFGSQISVVVGAGDVSARMAQSDLCFGAAGSTAWERCCLGLPTAMIVIAENQKRIASELQHLGAAIHLGNLEEVDASDIAACVEQLSQSPDQLRTMSEKAARICDGLGCSRITEMIAA